MRFATVVIFVLACVARVSAGQVPFVVARIYPEKQIYLVGEPVFLSLELINKGEQGVVVDSRFGGPCATADIIEVVGAKRRSFAWAPSCFGGTAGSCGSSGIELPPGKKHVERIFLSGLFLIENPGIYEVRARRNITVYVYTNDFFSVKSVEASSDFRIKLTPGKEDELKAAFAPFVRDLTSPNSTVQSNAVDAITTMAPRFLEDVILRLADTPNWAAGTVAALGALNTRQTKKKLAALAEHSDLGGTRQPAIGALAQTRDPAVLPVLKRIAKSGAPGDRDFALWNMGLFGKAAVPFLASTLRRKDVNTIAAVRGLGASATRSAVPILIEMLRSSDRQWALEARVNLAQLTHFSIDGKLFVQDPPANEWRRWRDWWVSHRATAEIFDTSNCSQPRPLP